MKKYFSGLTAIIFAIAFSAFTKPTSLQLFLLTTDPVTSGIVDDPNEWSTEGLGGYATCDINPPDVACEILLNFSTMLSYSHATGVGSERVLNDFTFANAQTPKKDYINIYVAIGRSPHYVITALEFIHWNQSLNTYVDVTSTLTRGVDYDFKNARD
jgi:hypothetical protein